MGKDIDFNAIDEADFIPDPDHFRLNACLKKVFKMPLTPEETEVIRDVNRRNGWDKPEPSEPSK